MEHYILAAGKSERIFSKIKINKCLIKINGITLIDNIINNSIKNKISKITVVTGFNEKLIKKKLKKKTQLNFLFNKLYNSRDMMHSVYLALKNCKNDLLITYSDIFFSSDVIKKIILKKKQDAIYVPVLKNWKKIWKIRNKLTINDAEDIKVTNNCITSIGQKISNNKKPKYQFMGIVFIPISLRQKVIDNYLKIKNKKKIHTTNFLNHLIKKNINVRSIKLIDNWYEFDDFEDYENFKKLR